MLKFVSVPLIPNENCTTPHTAYDTSLITSNMICAGYLEGGKDACKGDGGGPLIVQNKEFAVIYGIVNFGVGCARPDKAGVYTRVTNYIDWIQSNMNSEY